MKRRKGQQIKGMTPEQIEDLFAARLARIFVDQILERREDNIAKYDLSRK